MTKKIPKAGICYRCLLAHGALDAQCPPCPEDPDHKCFTEHVVSGVCPAGYYANPEALPAVSVAVKMTVRGARGLFGAAKSALRSGPAFVEMVEKRGAICQACPNAVLDNGLFRQCALCKCGIWAKVRDPHQKCPDAPPRWLAEELPPLAPDGE